MPKLWSMFFHRYCIYDADYGRSTWTCTSGYCFNAGNQSWLTWFCKTGRSSGSCTCKNGQHASKRHRDNGQLWKCNLSSCSNFRKYKLSASYSGNRTRTRNWNYRWYLRQTAQKCKISLRCTSGRTLAGRMFLLCRRSSGYYGRNQTALTSWCYDCNRKNTWRKSGRIKEKRILRKMRQMDAGI